MRIPVYCLHFFIGKMHKIVIYISVKTRLFEQIMYINVHLILKKILMTIKRYNYICVFKVKNFIIELTQQKNCTKLNLIL